MKRQSILRAEIPVEVRIAESQGCKRKPGGGEVVQPPHPPPPRGGRTPLGVRPQGHPGSLPITFLATRFFSLLKRNLAPLKGSQIVAAPPTRMRMPGRGGGRPLHHPWGGGSRKSLRSSLFSTSTSPGKFSPTAEARCDNFQGEGDGVGGGQVTC